MKPLTLAQAAESLSICEKLVLRHIRAGRILAFNVGTGSRPSYRIEPASIEAFKAGQRIEWQPKVSTATPKQASTITISGLKVIDFAALRAQKIAAKPKRSSGKSAAAPRH